MIALIVAAAVAATPAAAAAPGKSADQKICHKISYLGSRLNSTSICKTKAEWNELQFEHDRMLRQQQQLDRALNNNG
jgi:hypothetical protein